MSVVQRTSHSAWFAIITIIKCGFYRQINVKYSTIDGCEDKQKKTIQFVSVFLIVFAFTCSRT